MRLSATATQQQRPLCNAFAASIRLHHLASAAVGTSLQGTPVTAAAAWQRRHLCAVGLTARQLHSTRSAAAAADDAEEALEGELREDDDLLEGDADGLEEDLPAEISTGGTEWGDKALAVTQQLLSSEEASEGALADIELFSLRAIPSGQRLDIRLDKMTDRYGSPSLSDIATFSALFNAAYEEVLGEAAAGEIEVEVSSPGAERQVRVPGELERFGELPMRVEYAEGRQEEQVLLSKVLRFVEVDAAAGVTRWKLADVRANRAGAKGRPLGKKKDAVVEIALASISRVNLHVDI
ncbi:hypothetical protein D9Q98_003676 [Chlorella vulgaris]|uniref:DUF7912 domain-containing protein n=1 Tax=Chlorella vulgaris TaxID=3077 RepID=A0A9D4TT16_CHLVU|nr:hypothetical protein D9Q98_003676 [Chlorella vulgaris]